MSRLIVILAAGSRGDIQPCVALGRELVRRGDRVRVIASGPYKDLVVGAGLEFAGLSADPSKVLSSEEGQTLLAGGRSPVRFIQGLRRIFGPVIERLMNEALEGTRDADVFLCPSIGYFGRHVADHLGIPWALIHYQPTQPTGAFPHPFLPQARLLGGWGNRLSFQAVEQLAWQLSRPIINPWRRNSLALDELPLRGPMEQVQRDRIPTLACFSTAVVPRPADWPTHIHMTGYWLLPPEPDWRPQPALADFLAAGPPPVYVGFGSMVPRDAEAAARIIRTALRKAGVRGVVSGDLDIEGDDIFRVTDVPHTWLFPRMAAVVHHGGAGTTGAGLHAGVPTIICPFFGDQPYWGERVAALGAGTEPLPFDRLAPGALAQRIRQATESTTIQARAAAVGRRLSLEDGVGRACEVLDAPRFGGTGLPVVERRTPHPA